MSAWDAYPADYRNAEVAQILSAVQAGDCAALIGLSGAGKSNLVGFLVQRRNEGRPQFVLVDGNRAQPRSARGLLKLARLALGQSGDEKAAIGLADAAEEWAGLEAAVRQRLAQSPGGLCLVFDRYDALSAEEQAQAAGPLRALRDTFKYQLTYLIATRRPPDPNSELGELFYANTLWLGPLSEPDSRWSIQQYAGRRGQVWDEATLAQLAAVSWRYPSLLRACCEACASGCPLEPEALREHPAVQRRVQEFWHDTPSEEDLRRSGIAGHPLLHAARPAPDAESPGLTASEHRLLAYFQAHAGQVCGKDDLIRAVWPEEKLVEGLRDDSLAQLIRRLRVKIGPERVQTVPGRGYRYSGE